MPTDDDTNDSIEYEFRDGRWRRVGLQLVNEVSVEVDQVVLDDAVDVIWPAEPEACDCWDPEAALPCFACYLEGFEVPNPNAGE